MNFSNLFFAKFFGLYFIIVLILFLFRKEAMSNIMNKIVKDDATLATSGVISLFIGLVVVITHPYFKPDWRALLTLIGYFSIYKGIMRIAFQKRSREMIKTMREKTNWNICMFITLAVALVLLYNGFGR